MVGHHGHIRAPFFQSDKYTHADGMDTCLSHAVETIYPPFEFRFHSTRMIYVVTGFVVSFLKADDAVQSVFFQLGVFLGFEGHHFYLQVAEVFFCDVQRFCQIGNTCLGGILSCYQQQVFKRAELLDGFVFIFHLFGGEDGTCHRVADMETAVHTGVGAGVCYI